MALLGREVSIPGEDGAVVCGERVGQLCELTLMSGGSG
jgi:hypothetical protein